MSSFENGRDGPQVATPTSPLSAQAAAPAAAGRSAGGASPASDLADGASPVSGDAPRDVAPDTPGDAPRDADALARHLAAIEEAERPFAGLSDEMRAAIADYRAAIDALHGEAFRRLIKALKGDAQAARALRAAASDELVYAVLRHLQLLKPSLQERVEAALASVRPMLKAHGGDVALVRVVPPDTVELRFLGACDGCPASTLTFTAGVKKAIESHCPEITEIREVKGLSAAPPTAPSHPAHEGRSGDGADPSSQSQSRSQSQSQPGAVRFISPFAIHAKGDWRPACKLADIPEGDIITRVIDGEEVILSRNGHAVSCFRNACAHLGLPLDQGAVADGVLTCPHHGFAYDLTTGECLTAPEVQLAPHAVRVIDDRVEVRLAR